MTEEQNAGRLAEILGCDREEAKRLLRDDDLWLVLPAGRLGVPDDEAVKAWEAAHWDLETLVHVADCMGAAALVAVTDAQMSVDEALGRARKRVGEATQ
jgi:hypothetical protein